MVFLKLGLNRTNLLLVFLFLFGILIYGCGGGGGGVGTGVTNSGTAGSAPLSLKANFISRPEYGLISTVPSTAAGTVNIRIVQLAAKTEIISSTADFSAGTISFDDKIPANDTYAVYLTAHLKYSLPGDMPVDAVWEGSGEVFIKAPEALGSGQTNVANVSLYCISQTYSTGAAPNASVSGYITNNMTAAAPSLKSGSILTAAGLSELVIVVENKEYKVVTDAAGFFSVDVVITSASPVTADIKIKKADGSYISTQISIEKNKAFASDIKIDAAGIIKVIAVPAGSFSESISISSIKVITDKVIADQKNVSPYVKSVGGYIVNADATKASIPFDVVLYTASAAPVEIARAVSNTEGSFSIIGNANLTAGTYTLKLFKSNVEISSMQVSFTSDDIGFDYKGVVVSIPAVTKPSVSNITVTVSTRNVSLNYDLYEINNNSCDIDFYYSADSGSTFLKSSSVAGALSGVTPGIGKSIIWDSFADFKQNSDRVIVKLVPKTTAGSGPEAFSNVFALNNKPPALVSAEFMTENKLLLTFDEIVDLSTASAAGIKIAGTSLVSPSDTIAARNLSTQDTYAVLTVNSKSFNEADQANGIAGGTLNTGIELAAESNIKNITGRKIMTFTAGMTIAGDKTPPKDLTPAHTAALLFNNSTHQSFTTQPMAYSELAKLEVCFSPDPVPSLNLTAYSESAFAFSHNANDVIISSITAQNSGLMIFYRLKDRAGNVSGWVGNGNVPSTSNFSSIIITANQNGCGNSQNYINDKLASSVKNSAAPLNTENLTVVFGTALGAGNVKLSMKNGSNIANFESLANGSSAELMFSLKSGNAGQSLKDILGTSDGSLEVSFTVTDNAGNVSALTTDNLTVKYDVSVPVLSAAQLGKLAYGASKKVVIARGDLTGPDAYSEPAVLELCISTTLPVSNVSLNGYEQTFTQTHNQGDIIISSVINGAANDGVYYRLRDQAGNFGAWQQNGVTPFGPVVSNLAAHKGFGHIAASGGVSNIADTATMLKIFEDDDNNEANGGVNLVAAVTGIDLSMANGVIKNGLTLTSGKFIGYSIATKEGNESPIVYDGKIPQMPVPADLNCLSFSNLFKEVRAVGGPVAPGPGADPDLKLILYKNNAGVRIQAAIAPSENGSTGYQPGAQIISLASQLDDDTGISYAFVNSTGNCSAFADDGTVPAPPSAADVSGIYYTKAYSAVWSKNGSIIGDTTSTDLKLQIFENIGTVFALKGTAANVNGASGYAAGILIIDGALPLADNSYAAYAFVNSNGNQSRAAGREIVPAPPLVSNIRWINGKKAFEIIDGNVEITAAGNFLEVYEKDGASHLYKGRSVLAMTGTPYSTLLQDAALSIITGGREITYTSRTPAGNESAFADDGIVPQAPENAIVNNLCLRYNGPDYSLYNYEVSAVALNHDLKVIVDDGTKLSLAGKILKSACPTIEPSNFAPADCFGQDVNGLTPSASGGTLKYTYIKPGNGPGDGNESDAAIAGTIPAKPDSVFDNWKVKNDVSITPFKYRLYNGAESEMINLAKNLRVYVGDVLIGQARSNSRLSSGFVQDYYRGIDESSDETALKNTAINGGVLSFAYYDAVSKNESEKYTVSSSIVPQKPVAASELKIRHSRSKVSDFCVYNNAAGDFKKEENTVLTGYLGTSQLSDSNNQSSYDVIGASTLVASAYGGVALNGLSDAGGPLSFIAVHNDSNESPAVFAGVVPEAPSNFANLRVKYDNSEQPQYRLYSMSGDTDISSEVRVYIGGNSLAHDTQAITVIYQNGTINSANNGGFGTDNITPNPNGGALKALISRNDHESLWSMNQLSQQVPALDLKVCRQLRIKNGQTRSDYFVQNIGPLSFDVSSNSTIYIGKIRTNLTTSGPVGNGEFISQEITSNPAGGKLGISYTVDGNESMIYGDTDVPASIPDGKLMWSNATSKLTVKNASVGTGTEEIRVYSKNSDFRYAYMGRTDENNGSQKIVFVDGSYRVKNESFPDNPVLISENVAYSLYNKSGNESPYVDGGAVPAAISSGALTWSNARSIINISGSNIGTPSDKIMVYEKNNSEPYTYTYRGSNTFPVSGPFDIETNGGICEVRTDDNNPVIINNNICYTLKNSLGNESKFLDGGPVPAAPPANNIAWSDRNSTIKITGDGFGSSTSKLSIYQKSLGQADYSYIGSPVDFGEMISLKSGPYLSGSEYAVRGFIEGSYSSDPIIISLTEAAEVAYTIQDENGNESAYRSGGSVPAAPPAGSFRWSNATSNITISAGYNFPSTDETLQVYSYSNYNYSYSGKTVSPGPYSANKSYDVRNGGNTTTISGEVHYTLLNNNGNESAYRSGGKVPATPPSSGLTWNSSTKKIVVSSSVAQFGSSTDYMKVYNKTSGGVYSYLSISYPGPFQPAQSYDVSDSTIKVLDTAAFTLFNTDNNESSYNQ